MCDKLIVLPKVSLTTTSFARSHARHLQTLLVLSEAFHAKPLYGRDYAKSKKGKVTVGYGHSKGRKDLTQLVQLLVTTDRGLPFWQKTYSGNASDKEIFIWVKIGNTQMRVPRQTK